MISIGFLVGQSGLKMGTVQVWPTCNPGSALCGDKASRQQGLRRQRDFVAKRLVPRADHQLQLPSLDRPSHRDHFDQRVQPHRRIETEQSPERVDRSTRSSRPSATCRRACSTSRKKGWSQAGHHGVQRERVEVDATVDFRQAGRGCNFVSVRAQPSGRRFHDTFQPTGGSRSGPR